MSTTQTTSPTVSHATALVTLTDAAKQRLGQIADIQPAAKALRISLHSSGCAGLKYDFELVNEINPADSIIHQGKLALVIDPMSEIYLAGSTLDYVDNGLGAAFDFINPNETRRCGCGKSFTPRNNNTCDSATA